LLFLMNRGSLVDRDAEHDQGDARHVKDGRDLAQHDRADDSGEDR